MKKKISISGNLIRSCILLILCFCTLVLPTLSAADLNLSLDQFIYDTWTKKDGLPSNNITSIIQTRDGYLWIGTLKGLVRYNGYRFRIFNNADHPRISGIKVNNFCQDQSGILWICSDNGLFSYFKGTFKRYSVENGLSSNNITSVYLDRNKNIWVGTKEGYLNRLFSGRVMIYDYDRGLPNPFILAIGEDSDGRVWVAVKGKGVFKLVNGRFKMLEIGDFPSSSSLKSIYTNDAGDKWYLASRGVLMRSKRDMKFFTKRNGLSSNMISQLTEDSAGNVWIGTFNGLNRLKKINALNYKIEKTLQNVHITVISEDQEGSLWLGTRRSGLKRIRIGKFIPLTTDQGLENDYILGLYQDKKKIIWIATLAGLITLENNILTSHFDRFPFESVLAIREDPFGSIWFGTEGYGVYRYRKKKLASFSINEGLSNNFVTNIYFDKTGAGWFCTQRGISQYKNGIFTVYDTKSAIPERVYFIFRDFSGNTYAGTSDGLFQFSDGEFYRVFPELTGHKVCSIVEDTELFLWIGTMGKGLFRKKDSQLTKIDVKKLNSESFFSMVKGADDFLWSTSGIGIIRISIAKLNQFCDRAVKTVPFNLYTTDDGLKESQFTWAAQSIMLSNENKIMVASKKGLAVIDLAALPVNNVPPPVKIETVKVNGIAVKIGENRFNRPETIEIGYTALTFISNSRAGIKYRLEPLNDSWIDTSLGQKNTVKFTSLARGKYSFKILACNSDGIWNRTGDLFQFEVYYDFFVSPLFQILLSVLALLLLILIFHLYKKKKQKFNS